MLEFETSSGNKYAWDDEIGLFIPLSTTMEAVKNKISKEKSITLEKVIETFLTKDFDPEEITFCYNWIKKWEKIRPQDYYLQNYQEMPHADMKNVILNEGISQLTLGVTEDCNFRCKFCVYSDNYEYTRNHSNRYMSFSTAKKAIDYYLSLVNEGKKHNPIRTPAFGFYGGEPLLNFELIKRCVEYIDKKYKNEKFYTLTTNGSTLDRAKSKWLMDNNFHILVSLNGPQEEHNRLRVYKDGKDTFKDVIKNINLIVDDGYKDISSMPVFDWKVNLFEWENFFNRNEIPSAMMVSEVSNTAGSKYYKQFTKEDYFEFLKQWKKARDYYFENTTPVDQRESGNEKSVFDNLFGMPIGFMLFKNSINIPSVMPFTGACIPGRKIFVDIDGNYHLCERVNDSFPIGNVDEGLNFEKINRLLSEFFNHMDKCKECKIRRQCDCCFQNFMTDDELLYSSEVCKEKEAAMKDNFASTLEIAEKFPEFADGYNLKQKNIKKYWGE